MSEGSPDTVREMRRLVEKVGTVIQAVKKLKARSGHAVSNICPHLVEPSHGSFELLQNVYDNTWELHESIEVVMKTMSKLQDDAFASLSALTTASASSNDPSSSFSPMCHKRFTDYGGRVPKQTVG